MRTLSPIALFVYNRPDHIRKTVEALRQNDLASSSRLFVFSDGPRDKAAVPKVMKVREYISQISGFASVEIIERVKNLGLSNSIIDGVTQVVNEFGRVIVLEDDLITSPYFLNYMNDGLDLYEDEPTVATIQGHIYPLDLSTLPQSYFLPFVGSWGWGTWQRDWECFCEDEEMLRKIKANSLEWYFDLNGSWPYTKLLEQYFSGSVQGAWDVCWRASNFLLNKKALYPSKSFVYNNGIDGLGEHAASAFVFKMSGDLAQVYEPLEKIPAEVNEEVLESVVRFLKKITKKRNILVRIFHKIRRIFFLKYS